MYRPTAIAAIAAAWMLSLGACASNAERADIRASRFAQAQSDDHRDLGAHSLPDAEAALPADLGWDTIMAMVVPEASTPSPPPAPTAPDAGPSAPDSTPAVDAQVASGDSVTATSNDGGRTCLPSTPGYGLGCPDAAHGAVQLDAWPSH